MTYSNKSVDVISQKYLQLGCFIITTHHKGDGIACNADDSGFLIVLIYILNFDMMVIFFSDNQLWPDQELPEPDCDVYLNDASASKGSRQESHAGFV